MKLYLLRTKLLVSILCLICLLTTGYIAEGSNQLVIEVPYLSAELPLTWRPTAGGSLSFNVKVTKPPNYSGGTLTARLSEVTNYQGICGNRSSINSSENDLQLLVNDGTTLSSLPALFSHFGACNTGWSSVPSGTELSHTLEYNSDTEDTAIQEIPLDVLCFDYAAYGKLTFTTTGSSSTEANPFVIIIPRDINGNKIADCWRYDETTAFPNNNNNPSKNYVASWDEESGPRAPNTQRGDNLTVLDEYRGLYINGSWTDTDPEGWDVFIRSECGLGSAGNLPGMTPHLMGLNEVTHDGGIVVDYSTSTSSWPTSVTFPPPSNTVYAIRLKNNPVAYDENNPETTVGHMYTGPPSSWTRGDIFTDRIRGSLNDGQTLDGIIARVVAHEIGHGVHLAHCPDHGGLNCYMWLYTDAVSHHETQYHSHHLVDYDLKFPTFSRQTPLPIPEGGRRHYVPENGIWSLLLNEPIPLDRITVRPSRNDDSDDSDDSDGSTNLNNSSTNSGSTIISTNTGDSSYGCGYNAEYDYCTDTGTCTTRTGPNEVGMCGHRWCCCAPITSSTSTSSTTTTSTSVISTNTGDSSYGCGYNAEYDYCTDTGTCFLGTGSDEVGMCGHRWCCCVYR